MLWCPELGVGVMLLFSLSLLLEWWSSGILGRVERREREESIRLGNVPHLNLMPEHAQREDEYYYRTTMVPEGYHVHTEKNSVYYLFAFPSTVP